MTEPTFININERAYKYIRQFTIKSVDDALIELVTNCIDAYKKTSYIEKNIEIEIFNPKIIKVRDRALGLTAEQLEKCFLQVGNFTADGSSRGFFSRGAKDISALGNITFNSIKDGLYSQCTLNTDAYGMITIANVPITPEIRQAYKIADPFNGLEVTIELLPTFQNMESKRIYDSLCSIAVLRDIVSNTSNIIMLREFNSDGTKIYENQIKYVYPTGEMILDIEYQIPQYADKKARFIVYRATATIKQPSKESELEFGFLMKDSTSIYECNTIQDRFRWNPYMNHLYGYLYCDAIHDFLIDYDINGASETNPYPIIDPSRLTGLNKQHPFIMSMLSIPAVRLDAILRDLNRSVSSKLVSVEDIDDLLDELQKYGVEIVEKEEIKVSFVPSYDANLAKAVEEERANYITYEKSYVLANNYDSREIEIDNYVKSEIVKMYPDYTNPNFMFILDEQNKLVQLPNRSITDLVNEPLNLLELIPSEHMDAINKRPYIFKLGENGTVQRLYIYDKGKMDPNVSAPDTLIVRNKQFNIEFIDDLNIQQRYIFDYTDGVKILINLNNPIIRKNLVTNDINDFDQQTSLSRMSSTKTIVFMKELITDIMCDLIVENDIKNKKITLDSTDFNNGKKVIDYRNSVVTKIELGVDSIFDKLLGYNKTKKVSQVLGVIQNISTAVGANMEISNELAGMKDALLTLLTNAIE